MSIWFNPNLCLFVYIFTRRTQSTQAYTTKLLSGYTMHDEQCSKCDMPMMKINDTVECIFCPEEEEDTESDVEEEEDVPVVEAPLKEVSFSFLYFIMQLIWDESSNILSSIKNIE